MGLVYMTAANDVKFEHMLVMSWITGGMEREDAVSLYNEIFNIQIVEEENDINPSNDGRN